jgi:hypothetical protein
LAAATSNATIARTPALPKTRLLLLRFSIV